MLSGIIEFSPSIADENSIDGFIALKRDPKGERIN